VPQVTVVHDLLPLHFPAEYPRQQYYFRSLVPRVLRSSRIIVADSGSTRLDIIQSYGIAPERVRVIYPGYDPDTYRVNGIPHARLPCGDGYVLYVGNLLPHKNLLSLLDALAILRRRHRGTRLIIRGEGQATYARAVRERVETLGLSDVVSFQGYAGKRALRDLYAGAACLVLPSLREGFGLPVLEAMACGTPVITSSSSSLPEVGGDAAILVDPYDAIDLSDAMYRVLAMPASARSCGSAASSGSAASAGAAPPNRCRACSTTCARGASTRCLAVDAMRILDIRGALLYRRIRGCCTRLDHRARL
jgi:glycosyltransferase involved in cell wall biosynthesis